MQIIPAIDLKDNKCVRLSKGKDSSSVVYNEDPEKQAIYFEQIAKEDNIKSLQLAVRETQDAAIKLFTGKDYTKWGENPYYAYINGSFIKGYYYYKNI